MTGSILNKTMKRSPVWQFFEKNEIGAVCRLQGCNKQLYQKKDFGSTKVFGSLVSLVLYDYCCFILFLGFRFYFFEKQADSYCIDIFTCLLHTYICRWSS